MLKKIAFAATALTVAAATTAAVNSERMLHEEMLAHEQEALIIQKPIAGIENHFWFDYRNDVNEARKELSSDLARASDTEDLRDAWGEYGHELAHERTDYIKEMAERGYSYGAVTFEG